MDELVRRIDREANDFERIKDLDDVDPNEAEQRLNQLNADFASLQQYSSDIVYKKANNSSPLPTLVVSPVPSPAAAAR